MKPASPNINDILARFIADEDPPSIDPYVSRTAIAECIQLNLNMYGHTTLTAEQGAWAMECYDEEDEAGSFCNLFGPDYILPSFDDFLGYFMVAKIMGPPEMTAAAGPVCIDLARWMGAHGFATESEVEEAVAVAQGAASDLPAADAASALLHEHWQAVHGEERLDDLDWDGGALITRIDKHAIWVREVDGGEEFGPVVIPRDASVLLEPGWVINSPFLVKTPSGWHIAESGFIHTDASRFD